MSVEEIKQREIHFKEFGDLLARRHGQNYYVSFHNKSRVTVDEAAVRFGRYLSSARANTHLSISELAAKARVSETTLIALEQGLILACDIKPRWLRGLAKALGENPQDFNLLLGRQISSGNSRWLTERLVIKWRNWLIHSKVSLVSRPVYAACSALLLFFVIGAVSIMSANISTPPPHKETYSYINVSPEHRLNMVKAEFRLESQVLMVSANLAEKNCCIH